MNISLLFYGIPSEYMSISYTVHLHQNKHDLPWFCKKKKTQKCSLVMEHYQVSWRNLELLWDAWPMGLHEDFRVVQNPQSVCIKIMETSIILLCK